jgi:hypothetical protein
VEDPHPPRDRREEGYGLKAEQESHPSTASSNEQEARTDAGMASVRNIRPQRAWPGVFLVGQEKGADI